MNLLLLAAHAARGALIFGVGLAALRLLRGASASVRRFVLVVTFAAALAVPFASAVAPAWRLGPAVSLGPAVAGTPFAEPPVPEDGLPAAAPQHNAATARASANGAQTSISLPSVSSVAFAIWALGALFVLGRLVAALLSARRVVQAASPLCDVECQSWVDDALTASGVRARVLVSDRVDTPAVAGVLMPVILMPSEALVWSRARWQVVLLHELAHVRNRDGLAYVVAELACAVHWFDPLAWWAARRLHVERELAADDHVLSAGVRPSTFAEHLIAVATGTRRSLDGALGMARPSQLATRVRALVAPDRSRTAISAYGGASVSLLGGAAVLAVACARPGTPVAPEAPQSPPLQAAEARTPATQDAARDPALQAIADEETDKLAAEWKPTMATVVVLDPSTGSVLAMTSRAADGQHDVALTRATRTGSTIKPIVVAAAIDEKAITPTQRFDCGHGERAYGKKVLHDVGTYDSLDAAHILAVSSNVGTSRIFDALGPAKLAPRFAAFHFGQRLEVGISDVAAGEFSGLTKGDPWGAMLAAIGEGMTATPMQMVAAYAALANGGVYHRPKLAGPADAGEQVVSAETAHTVVTMMEQVVEGETGTGKRARVAGVRVAGKTGTADQPEVNGQKALYASFIGLVPSDRSRFVILVGAEVAGRDDANGGAVAAPVFARVATRALTR